MFRLTTFLCLSLVLFPFNLFSTEYWSPERRNAFEQQKAFLRIGLDFALSQPHFPAPTCSGVLPNFSYPAEFLQIAQFLSQWQVLDPTSPDYGGMIEAESGALGNVIQTDNTQEAIVVWCQYANLTGDTSTYRNNIDAAWTYIMNYPAYAEEGSTGDDYYRDHNCAWALWGAAWYQTVYSDSSYRWYADSCAGYIVRHQLPVFTPGSNLNAFVMGWMAGNLYRYGRWTGNTSWNDSAVVIGNKVLTWANADPVNNLSDFTWAMSSGTAVWGLCNSVFQADSLAGVNWIQTYAQYLPLYFDNQDPGDYTWDSAWNVALVNAYQAMHQLSINSIYNGYHRMLTDTLLALDRDDDGGIMANKLHPPTEDMTWVSAYLNVMGVDYRLAQSFALDAGVVQISEPDSSEIYLIGDTLSVLAQVANFGFQDLTGVNVELLADSVLLADSTLDLPFAAVRTLQFPQTVAVTAPGSLTFSVRTQVIGDQNPANDRIFLTLHIPDFILVEGFITDAETGGAVGGTVIFDLPGHRFQTQVNPATGYFQIQVIPGVYSVFLDTDFPFQQQTIDSVSIGTAPPPPFHWTTLRGDLVLIDDDEGAGYEFYFQDALQKIFHSTTPYPWKAYHHWDVAEKGIFPASRLGELKHPYVIWFTGDADSTALTPAERDTLLALQNRNADILLTGKDIAEGVPDSLFLAQALHVRYRGNSTFVPRFVYGVSGDPLSDSLNFSTWGGFGANNQFYDRDIVQPLAPAQTIFHYLPADSQSAGIRFEGNYKLIFLGFGVEGIRDNFPPYNNRRDLLVAVLSWFQGISGFTETTRSPAAIHSFHLFPLYPNPFNSSVVVRFFLSQPQRVKLAVFDVLGRRVALLIDRPLKSGLQQVCWNGTTDSGNPAASGIYYFRLSSQFQQRVQKGLYLR